MKTVALKLTFLLALFSLSGFAQELKTYNGPSSYQGGVLSYQYYEDSNLKRIYHGKFVWKQRSGMQITGQFQNHRRTGLWEWKDTDYPEDSVLYSFNKGVLDGPFILKVDYGKNRFIANFKNGQLIGPMSLMEPDINIKINFNDFGQADGNWNINYKIDSINYYDTRVYTKGFLKERLCRNVNTGEVIINIKDNHSYDDFQTLNNDEIKEVCLKKGYDIIKVNVLDFLKNDQFSFEGHFGKPYNISEGRIWEYVGRIISSDLTSLFGEFKSNPLDYWKPGYVYNYVTKIDPNVIKWEGSKLFCNKENNKTYEVESNGGTNSLITIRNKSDNKVYFGFNNKEGLSMKLLAGDTEDFEYKEGKLIVKKVLVTDRGISWDNPQLIYKVSECEK